MALKPYTYGYLHAKKPSTKELPLKDALYCFGKNVYFTGDSPYQVFTEEECVLSSPSIPDALPVHAILPPISPQHLGDPSFCADHNLHFPYYTGAMANGVASEDIVEAMGKAGMLGFFGAAGLSPARIEHAVQRLGSSMGEHAWGCNLINNPNEPEWERQVVELYLKYKVRLVEASAFIVLTLPLVRYRVHGIYRDADGKIITPNKVIAKLSRVEVATRFFEPPPEKMLKKLLEAGEITEEQAAMAREIPMAQDVTVEADSGGHTDHRPAFAALPAMLKLRDTMQEKYSYSMQLRVGLGGGIGEPTAAAAAFTMGAAYIVTGSINQACQESGTSDTVREMLAKATSTDVGEAPAADMFEKGVTVQVLKKGNKFTLRGAKLYEIYRTCNAIEDISAEDREKIEKDIFQDTLEAIWEKTRTFFEDRDPRQIEKAEANPRYKMALVFRWYLGLSSTWAKLGTKGREEDYQIWCGPAMGAFNDWVAGSFLEEAKNRKVVSVALNLLVGAMLVQRISCLRRQGITVPFSLDRCKPKSLDELEILLRSDS